MFANDPQIDCHPEASEGPCIQLNYSNVVCPVMAPFHIQLEIQGRLPGRELPECLADNTRSLGGLGMTMKGGKPQDDVQSGDLFAKIG
jgi:hypothetical protein